MAVKRYKKPGLIKKIIYRFRRPKALRAYDNELSLKALGFSTPEPVGRIITYNSLGCPVDSFYICLFVEMPPLVRFFEHPDGFDRNVIAAFALYVAELHLRGVLFDDLNNSNVLVDIRPDKSVNFSLIDINRMRFMNPARVSLIERFRNISRFCYDRPDIFEFFAEKYIEAAIKIGLLDSSIDPLKFKQMAIDEKRRSDNSRRRLQILKHPLRTLR